MRPWWQMPRIVRIARATLEGMAPNGRCQLPGGEGCGAQATGGRLANSGPWMPGGLGCRGGLMPARGAMRPSASWGALVRPFSVPQSSSFQLTPVMKRRSIL
ncbi:hypothetical protein HMPREF0551_0246 [Lautropia mirabilis ATCC 51599]|uniref:Uncharacterized protein n=1 Tax=Lautropia mirabilis ATCC 51599 TaxID=887898 RepID=E7RUT0_9BURK|nr:hypothetical protein HMPREF0551_0246 [Lautropia mirabilis ATCC 51599]